MLPFIYESTIILGFTYGFYYFFLKRSRSFAYIRYYFLIAMLLSVSIPFIEVEIGSNLPLLGSVSDGRFYTLVPVMNVSTQEATGPVFPLNTLLFGIYFMGFGLMFFRFSLNLIKLIRKRKQGESLEGFHGRIILTNEEGLPYSFFQNIFMSRLMYEKGEDLEKLLLHEGAHCKQAHSVDILLAELLKVFLWFNPFVWLISNAIRLNHEYLADEKVLESQNLHTYQLLLINLELANQSIYLASDFNYSLTRKRLAMMNKNNWGKKTTLYKLAVVPLFLILAAMLTFCEAEQAPESDPYQTMQIYANDWWRPILAQHEITPKAYNNFENIFEMGSTNSIDENNVVTLSDALFVIRQDKSSYAILRSPLATHDLETGIISGEEGILESFNLLQKNAKPSDQFEMKNFTYQLVANKHKMSADYMSWHTNEDEVVKGWSGSFTARDSLAIDRIEE